MGNQQLRQRLENGQISMQDIIRYQQGNLDIEDYLYGQQNTIKEQKVIIDEEFSSKFKDYYNYTKRISKQNLLKIKKKPIQKRTQKDKEQYIKQRNFQYKKEDLHYYIPNKYKVIKELQCDPYNMTLDTTGQKILITSRQGLDVYSEKNKSNNYEFDSQIFPGTISWTITDSDLSRDNNLLVHSTMNPIVSVYSLNKNKYVHMFNMSDNPEQDDEDDWQTRVRIFSVKFNSDSSKLIASTGGNQQNHAQLKLYDVQHQYLQKSIPAHEDDINTICYLNRDNSNVFISGSDDSLIKIWDTRALGVNNTPVGYMLGHCCGITKVSSREDGFYIASNSKDQSCKLWDIRKSCESNQQKPTKRFFYDYRGQCLTQDKVNQIKNYTQQQNFDNSVASFYGHQVFRTLIRCHFSPQSATGSRYIYSGSGCGKVFIYDIMTGKTAAILDSGEREVVRDLQWHPNKHKIFVAGWDEKLVEWSFDPDFKNIKKVQKSETQDEEQKQDQNQEESNNDIQQPQRSGLFDRLRQNLFYNSQPQGSEEDDDIYDDDYFYDEEQDEQNDEEQDEQNDEELEEEDLQEQQYQELETQEETQEQDENIGQEEDQNEDQNKNQQ